VDSEYERLTPIVHDWVQQPTTIPWGNRSLLFRDPDRNPVNFFTPVTEAATPPTRPRWSKTSVRNSNKTRSIWSRNLLDDLDGSPSASATVRDLLADARLHNPMSDLLGGIRPTVVRLMNDNVLPAERIGNRHRLLLDNALAYREDRRKRQYDALAATAIDIDSNDNPETIRKQLREACGVVTARRRYAARPS